MLRHPISQKCTDLSKDLSASIIRAIALIMEVVNMPETSVSFYQTTPRNIPEHSRLYTRWLENLKSHVVCRHRIYLHEMQV
jgi:hypothetical protein